MDGWFIFAIIIAVIALLVTVAWQICKRKLAGLNKTEEVQQNAQTASRSSYGGYDHLPPSRSKAEMRAEDDLRAATPWLKRFAIGLWIFTAVLVLWSSVHQVDTKNVGAVASFGRPVGNLDNGLHMTLPWQVVTELDAALQTDSFAGQDDTPCVVVKIARQATACVDFTVKWQLRQDKADEIFQTFREFEKVKDSLITRELPAAGNVVFADYDPTALDGSGNFTAASNVTLSEKVTEELRKRSGNRITIESVVVNNVGLSKEVQDRLNELNNETAKTRVALQAQKTADAQAEANRKLAGSLSNDPNVLVSRCLDLVGLAVDRGYQLPAGGVNCWPGGQSAVVLPSVGGNRPN